MQVQAFTHWGTRPPGRVWGVRVVLFLRSNFGYRFGSILKAFWKAFWGPSGTCWLSFLKSFRAPFWGSLLDYLLDPPKPPNLNSVWDVLRFLEYKGKGVVTKSYSKKGPNTEFKTLPNATTHYQKTVPTNDPTNNKKRSQKGSQKEDPGSTRARPLSLRFTTFPKSAPRQATRGPRGAQEEPKRGPRGTKEPKRSPRGGG